MSDTLKRGRLSKRESKKEWPEKMRLSEARKFLGISIPKMTSLVRSGRIAVEDDPLDGRVRLVKRSDLEKLLRSRTHVK